MADYDVIVVGGGIVGISIAYGLARSGKNTAVFDEGDIAFRAARGNFGLIWVQGKGTGCQDYAAWTRRSANHWKDFSQGLESLSGIDIAYRRPGGIDFCLTEEEFEARSLMMARLIEDSNGEFKASMLRRDALCDMLPGLAAGVSGASFSPMDGHVNPLNLLRALHAAFKAKGGKLHIDAVLDIGTDQGAFDITTRHGRASADKVVLAAGLANRELAPKLGLNVPVRPQRGQILVTERLQPFLNYPTSIIRQTCEGSVQLGDSHEEVGFDDGTSVKVMAEIAHRARCVFPHLEKARIVRAWGALRILTPDGLPVYDQSLRYPGAFSASSHSGVTLAAVHAQDFADYVVAGKLPVTLQGLSERRFNVH